MATKDRKPITNAEEILAWATQTRDAEGNAHTPLSKSEQLLIAQFILAMRDHIKKLQSGEQKSTTPPSSTPKAEEPTPAKQAVESKPQSDLLVREFAQDRKQTNMEFFKANSIGMQRAYELFLVWQNLDPSNRMVLDKTRDAYVNSAAFAYWLNMAHE